MGKYDILFFDIDGPVIGSDHFTLSPRNRAALLAAREAGILLCVATGRCLHIVPQQVMDLSPDYVISSNGAAIHKLPTEAKIYHNGLTPGEASVACSIIRKYGNFIEFFVDGDILLAQESYDQIGTHSLPVWHKLYFSQGKGRVAESVERYIADGVPGLEKIALIHYPPEVIARIHAELTETGLFYLSSSIGRSLEIVRRGCNKGAAIQRLCQQLNISLARTAACGDGNNDMDMFRTVGASAAMGNAKDALKEIATCTTAPYDQDGVAEFIEKYVL